MKTTRTTITKSILLKAGMIFIMGGVILSCSDDTLTETDTELFLQSSKTLEAKLDKATTWQEQVAILEQKMRRFHNFQVAIAQGYQQVSPYVPNMGYHYAKFEYVDGEFSLLEPELLVYYPDKDGNMIFGAAEYLIPMGEDCDAENPPFPAPEGFIGDADHWHVNCNAGGWTLHAWVGTVNPAGVFVAFNPDVPATPADQ